MTRSTLGRLKLNTNGARKSTSSTEAEVRGLVAGMDFCYQMGLHEVDIEVNSINLLQLLRLGRGHWKVSDH